MAVRVAINGFGRIGRLVFRALVEQGLLGTTLDVVAVGDIVPADNLAYLLKYDSIQGRFTGTVGSRKSTPDKLEDDVLIVNGKEIIVTHIPVCCIVSATCIANGEMAGHIHIRNQAPVNEYIISKCECIPCYNSCIVRLP